MAQNIISQTPISSAELHAEMKRIKKRDEELGFRAQKTVDYLESVGTLDKKKAAELMKKLEGLKVPRLRDVHFIKLMDIMPTNPKDVKVALQGYNMTVSQESCKKLATVLSEYA